MTIDFDLQQAVNHHRAEQFAAAEHLYRAILKAKPDHAEVNYNLGVLAVQTKRLTQGLRFFEAAVAACPQRPDFWATYVEVLVLGGQTEKALQVRELARQRGFALDKDEERSPVRAGSDRNSESEASLAAEFVATLEILSKKGLDDSAEELSRQMVLMLPHHVFGWKTLAYAYLRRGDLVGALAHLAKASALSPEDAELNRHYRAALAMQEGLALEDRKDFAAAGRCFQEVLDIYPNHPDANHRLGVVSIRLGQPAAAAPYLERALGANPNQQQYWVNYVDALIQSGQLKAAWTALEMGQQRGLSAPVVDELIAIMTLMSSEGSYQLRSRRIPADRDLTTEMASNASRKSEKRAATPRHNAKSEAKREAEQIACAAHFNVGRVKEALAIAEIMVKRFPDHGFGWKMVGLCLHRLARYDEAMEYLPKALELLPQDTDTLQAAAGIHESAGRHAEAEAECRRLLQVNPNHVEGLRILAIALMSMQRVQEAETVALKVIQLAPGSALPKVTLGSLYVKQGRLAEACEVFRQTLEIEPDNELAYNNLAFAYTTMEDVTPDEVFAEHRRFGEHFEKKFAPLRFKHAHSNDPERRLRIGFISGDFCNHAVASFISPVLSHLSQNSGLSLYAYSNTPIRDHVTELICKEFGHWHDIFGMADEKVAGLVRDDEIDILIDLAGHSANNRLLVLARKPAPLQATWIGYPGTTGLDAVDYFLADRFWVPSENFRKQFTEKIAYLPALAPFSPEKLSPPINMLPAMRNGHITFGSFNRMDKLRRDVIALWAQLLRAVPNSRMLIGAMPKDDSLGELPNWFADEGISPDRLDFRKRSSVAVYLQQHHHVDICLDTFPFSGLTTGLHSLWMGVPTLTLPGQTVPGRSGATAMSHVGLEQFVAQDKMDFIQKGIQIASDIPALAAMRSGMRERCNQSPMFRPQFIAEGVAEALRVMWRRWCDGLPAESFDISGATKTA